MADAPGEESAQNPSEKPSSGGEGAPPGGGGRRSPASEKPEKRGEASRLAKIPKSTAAVVGVLCFLFLVLVWRALSKGPATEAALDGQGRHVVSINMWEVPRPGSMNARERANRAVFVEFLKKDWRLCRRCGNFSPEGPEGRDRSGGADKSHCRRFVPCGVDLRSAEKRTVDGKAMLVCPECGLLTPQSSRETVGRMGEHADDLLVCRHKSICGGLLPYCGRDLWGAPTERIGRRQMFVCPDCKERCVVPDDYPEDPGSADAGAFRERLRGEGADLYRARYACPGERHVFKIRKTRGIRVEGTQKESAFLMAMAGGTAPDCFPSNFRSIRSFMDQGFVRDITEFVDYDWPKKDEFLIPRVRPVLSNPAAYPDGAPVLDASGEQRRRYFAVPQSFDDLMGIYFRKDLYQKAGLSPEGPVMSLDAEGKKWDWDGLYRVSQKLSIPEEGQYGMCLPAGFIAGWMFPNFVWQAGGNIVREWVECPVCLRSSPVPKNRFGVIMERPEELWDPGKQEWVERPRGYNPWVCHHVKGSAEKTLRIADAPGGKTCGGSLRKGRRYWRTGYDEEPGVRAFEFYKRMMWSKWTRCTSPQCSGRNVTFDVTDADMARGSVLCLVCGTVYDLQELRDRKRLYTGVAFADISDEAWRMFFEQRKLAMMFWVTSSEFVGGTRFDPEICGVVSPPAGPTGIKANFLNASIWAVNSAVKKPLKVKACWEYIKFLTSDEADAIRVRYYVEGGWARFIHPGKLKKFGYEEYLQFVPESWKRVFDELMENGYPEPYCPDYKSVATQEMAIPLGAVLFEEDKDPRAEAEKSARKVNVQYFGVMDPDIMARRRLWAKVMAVFAIGFFASMLTLFVRSLRTMIRAQGQLGGAAWQPAAQLAAWGFMLPAVATILIWQYVPLVRGSVMAFQDYKVLGGGTWIWLDNFIRIFFDDVFWKAVVNTGVYTFLTIVIGFGVPIFLALLLSEVPRFKVGFRVIYYLPAVTSGLVIMFLWKRFYDSSPAGTFNTILSAFGYDVTEQGAALGKWLHEPRGIVTWLLGLVGVEGGEWLRKWDAGMALLFIIIPGVWAAAGPGSIIYLAALKAVPDDMYEAADIDGASTGQKILYITLPYLKPLIIINFVGAFIGAFKANQNIFVMTGGGPGNQTLTLGLHIFLTAFLFLKFGSATAVSWIMGALLIGFTIYQLRILRRVRFTTAK